MIIFEPSEVINKMLDKALDVKRIIDPGYPATRVGRICLDDDGVWFFWSAVGGFMFREEELQQILDKLKELNDDDK